MRSFSLFVVSLCCFFFGIESTYDPMFSIRSNMRSPFMFFWTEPYASKFTVTISAFSPIHGLLGVCAFTQILSAIVQSIVIYVVSAFIARR